jgi:heme o synthase
MFSKTLNIFLNLIRFYLSLAITFSASVGYIIFRHNFDLKGIYTLIGVFLISGAASALNHYQEREQDALMTRTENRPLPLKEIKPGTVLIISAILGISGSCLLYFECSTTAALLGIINMAWYNAMYTPLKKKTSFSVLIGSLTGAVPPVIGFTAAGGSITDARIIAVAIFMLLWQIPHFWLLIIRYAKEYEKAGFVSVLKVLSEYSVSRIAFIWMLASMACSFTFPFYHILSNSILIAGLFLLNIVVIFILARSLFHKMHYEKLNASFRWIYFYQVLVLSFLILDSLNVL